jgi:hypothetical protein
LIAAGLFIEQDFLPRYYSSMRFFRLLLAPAALLAAACSSTLPTATDMEHYYAEAEKSAQRDINRLAALRENGRISTQEYNKRETAIKDSIPKRASELAWARHELTQSEMRGMSIPTPEAPVGITAPGGRGSGAEGSFYRQAGQSGAGYQQNSSARVLRPNQ